MGRLLGSYLSQKRKAAGLTQAAVAKRMGLFTSQFISNIERGTAPLPEKRVRALSQVLRIPIFRIVDVVARDIREEYEKSELKNEEKSL